MLHRICACQHAISLVQRLKPDCQNPFKVSKNAPEKGESYQGKC